MPCPTVSTGRMFLLSILDHIDCQAEVLGSFGFQALARPGGPGATILASTLAIFVALIGFRMILGYRFDGRDTVSRVLLAAVVVTLAASWPAMRTLAYETVLKGPGQLIALVASPQTLPTAAGGDLTPRLQGLDDAIVALTIRGTGRNSGVPGYAGANDFRGIALEDGSTMGWARVVWLSGTLAPIIAVRLTAGLLLALSPLLALTLLFAETRGLFAGWARGLVMCLLGSAALAIVHATQLAILEPWAAEALQLRSANYATPAVPTELLAVNLAFAVAANLSLLIMLRVAFQRGWLSLPTFDFANFTPDQSARTETEQNRNSMKAYSRVEQVISAIDRQQLSSERGSQQRIPQSILRDKVESTTTNAESTTVLRPLGETSRRTARRTTLSGQRRDKTL